MMSRRLPTERSAIDAYKKASDKDSKENLNCTSNSCPNDPEIQWAYDHKIGLYHDGSTDEKGSDGAFHDIVRDILDAQHFVFIVDWSFHPFFHPKRPSSTSEDSIGGILLKKAHDQSGVTIAIHTWNHTVKFAPDTDNDDAESAFETIAKDLKIGKVPPNLLWRASSRTGVGWSHHQKFVVCDHASPIPGKRDIKVFFGGLDITAGRFDWPAHIVSPKDAKYAPIFRQEAYGHSDWYNGEFSGRQDLPREPWHDIHACFRGPAAWDFVREFVGRWNNDPSWDNTLGTNTLQSKNEVWIVYKKIYEKGGPFIQLDERPHWGPWAVDFCHSIKKEHFGPLPDSEGKDALAADFEWKSSLPYSRSIQDAYIKAIGEAEKFIYIENQYFIGSGGKWATDKDKDIKNDIPDALLQQILKRKKEEFHVYVVMPMFPEGVPDEAGILQVRAYEWRTIQYMVTTLYKELGDKWADRLSFYFLANWSKLDREKWNTSGGREDRVRTHDRYMIYVHSKMMLVDDRHIIVGSANINERSMAGDRDTEIACWMKPGPRQEKECMKKLRAFRLELWKEHFGTLPKGNATPGTAACVQSTRAMADENYKNFREMSSDPKGHICRWPFAVKNGALAVESIPKIDGPESEVFIPDAPSTSESWQWNSPGSLTAAHTYWPE